jgi:hypothetical protein
MEDFLPKTCFVSRGATVFHISWLVSDLVTASGNIEACDLRDRARVWLSLKAKIFPGEVSSSPFRGSCIGHVGGVAIVLHAE